MNSACTLSIIIPCFNCEDTLVEAVDSIYLKKPEVPFEVILVDDASTDGTSTAIKNVIKDHKDIRAISHDVNRGGGASRNSGVVAAKGEFIYCLDGDNILSPGGLDLLLLTLLTRKADGAAFHQRLFFRDFTSSIKSMTTNKILDRSVLLNDLFSEEPVSLDNFLMTKKAWKEAGGFPEHHGFDTQSFELRFLGTGHSLWIARDSTFFHRRFQKEKISYFEREYERGAYSLNTYLCFEDVFHLFHPVVRREIMKYNVFSQTSLLKDNLWSCVRKLYKKNPNHFFVPNMQEYCVSVGAKKYYQATRQSTDQTDLMCHGIWKYGQKRYFEALRILEQITSQTTSPVLSYCLLRAAIGFSNTIQQNAIEQYVENLIRSIVPSEQQNELRSLPHFAIAKFAQALRKEV